MPISTLKSVIYEKHKLLGLEKNPVFPVTLRRTYLPFCTSLLSHVKQQNSFYSQN